MAMIRPESMPFESLDEARASVLAIRLAELMGLYRRPTGVVLDRAVLEEVAGSAARSGIAERIALGARWRGRERARLAASLLQALEASPVPAAEIRELANILGLERLAALCGTSQPSLRRYVAGERDTPDAVAQRIHFIARLVAALQGSYNEFGVRRWLDRPRRQLDGHAPSQLLAGEWDPDDDAPQRVRRLAETLLA
jgi:hypothetical protein